MDISKQNFFEFFSLPESFQIDVDLLNIEYKKLQAIYHPDKTVNDSDSQRLKALQISSILNDAYTTLLSPLKRAAYLLTLHGIDPEENNQSHLGGDFLFKQIELREQLENIAKNEDMDKLDEFKAVIEKDTQDYLQEFEALYAKTQYSAAKPVYSKLQFLFKLLSEIDLIEETLLEY